MKTLNPYIWIRYEMEYTMGNFDVRHLSLTLLTIYIQLEQDINTGQNSVLQKKLSQVR